MENQDYTPVEERSYSRIFFVVSMLLVVATLAAVWDEVLRRRPWKTYQTEFYELEYQKTKQEYEQKKAAIADAQAKLQAELTKAQEALTANPAYQEAQRKHKEVNLQLAEVTQEQRFAKSRLDEAYYWRDKAIEEKDESALQNWTARVKEREAEVAQYTPEIERLTQQKNALEQQIASLEKPIKDLNDQLFALTAEIKRIENYLKSLATDYSLFRVYTPPEIKQVVITGLDKSSFNEPLMRIDRCMTCHMGIDRAGFEDAPQPFTTHPDREKIFGKHPIEKFGCSICHLGQGVALETEEAHGEVKLIERTRWLNEPMLTGDWLQASCRQCHEEAFHLEEYAPHLVQGLRMFHSWGCAGCHNVEPLKTPPLNQLDKVGPSLVHIASKVYPSWLVRWVQNPKGYLPKTKMPNFRFSEEESEAVSAYLLASSTPFALPTDIELGDSAQGKLVFESIGCQGCHAINGQGGDFGPDLSQVASKVKPAWLLSWIKEPQRYNPHTKMPQVPLSDTQIRDLAAYLVTLGSPEETAALTQKLQNPNLIARGKDLVERYGCFGCHEIAATEQLSRVGAELSNFADKELVQMLFGHAEWVKLKSPALPSFEEMAALYQDGQKVFYSWEGWTYGKMKNARLYSTDRIPSQMPDFAFSDEQAKSMEILLRTFTEQRRSEPFLDPLTPQESIVLAGEELLAQYNCLGCHSIRGEGGTLAPQLTYEGSKVKAEWLASFLKEPTLIRYHLQARMPNFHLSDAQVQRLVDYIMTDLRDEERTPIGYMAKLQITPAMIEEGRKLFWETYPCYTCHRIGDQGTNIGPNLTHIASRLDPDWMFSWLKNPQAWEPTTIMPNLGLSDESAAAIVAYLASLPGPGREVGMTPGVKEATAPVTPLPEQKQAETTSAQQAQAATTESSTSSGVAEAATPPPTVAKAEPEAQGDPAQGKVLYQGFCVPCHGPSGAGDGPAAAGLDPKPRNFTDKAYMSQKTDAQLFQVIKEGGAAVGLSPAMPPWGAALQDHQIQDIIAFVRTLSGGE